MTIGEHIRELRLQHKMSQELLAEKMQVSRQAVTKWENNQCVPSAQKLMLLAGLFDISFEELVGDMGVLPLKKNTPWLFRGCLAVSLMLLLLFSAAVGVCIGTSPPGSIIGYADDATHIYVDGFPIHLVILGCLTLLSVLCTIFCYAKKRDRIRKGK